MDSAEILPSQIDRSMVEPAAVAVAEGESMKQDVQLSVSGDRARLRRVCRPRVYHSQPDRFRVCWYVLPEVLAPVWKQPVPKRPAGYGKGLMNLESVYLWK